jgi:GH15 family glucan-1,4-alpha-glucosidase
LTSLVDASVEVILSGQDPSGAFVASPTFPTYAYSWVRDGSFIAYALDRIGHHDPARRFHRWVTTTLLAHSDRAEAAISRAAMGHPPLAGKYLPCRFTLDGHAHDDDWPSFQLDGYGTWLWALHQHLQRKPDPGPLTPDDEGAIELVVRYLTALWQLPCYDCWEEHGDRSHPSTLGCLYGGLRAASTLIGDETAASTAREIQKAVLADCRPRGRLAKHLDDPGGVDASLLWCATPFGLVDPDDPLMAATVAEIERTCLDRDGGVHRYPQDTYYGGGSWPLLAAWLGWHKARAGRHDQARATLRQIEDTADPDGLLPEQTSRHLLDHPSLAQWEKRWGPAAHPLLWSHAMYLVLHAELNP